MALGPGAVAYQVGRFVYVYSSKTSTWDRLELQAITQGQPIQVTPTELKGGVGRGAAYRGAEDHTGRRLQHRVGQVVAPGPGRTGQRGRPADGPGPRRGGVPSRSICLCVPYKDVHVGSSGRRCRRQAGRECDRRPMKRAPGFRVLGRGGKTSPLWRAARDASARRVRPGGRHCSPETEQPLSKTSPSHPNRPSRCAPSVRRHRSIEHAIWVRRSIRPKAVDQTEAQRLDSPLQGSRDESLANADNRICDAEVCPSEAEPVLILAESIRGKGLFCMSRRHGKSVRVGRSVLCFLAVCMPGSTFSGVRDDPPTTPRFTPPPPAIEPAEVRGLIDRAKTALQSGQTVAEVLSDETYLPVRAWPRFRALIRQSAPSTPVTLVPAIEPGERLQVAGSSATSVVSRW